MSITVACLDMAGTTVADGGAVIEALPRRSTQNLPVPAYKQAMTDVRSSMGQSKIEVFRRILGDEPAARRANKAFEDHYAAAVQAGRSRPCPGPRKPSAAARRRHPGLPGHRLLPRHQGRHPRQARLGRADRPGAVPRRRGRGRPWPDLPLTALLRLRGGAVSELAVAGDTGSDIESGRRAGAAVVAGVLTGASSRADLEQAGAPLILDTIAGMLPYIVSWPGGRRPARAGRAATPRRTRPGPARRTRRSAGRPGRRRRRPTERRPGSPSRGTSWSSRSRCRSPRPPGQALRADQHVDRGLVRACPRTGTVLPSAVT